MSEHPRYGNNTESASDLPERPAHIGRRIASCRALKGWTQAELGDALDVSQTAVSAWESGRNQPSLDLLVRIADLFGVTERWLLRGDVPTPVAVPAALAVA